LNHNKKQKHLNSLKIAQEVVMGMEKKGKAIVVQANRLIKARWSKITLTEKKIYLKLVSAINAYDDDFKSHTFQLKDLVKELNLGKNNYGEIEIATGKLITRGIVIPEEDGPLQVTLMGSAKYNYNEGTVTLSFSSQLKPYLLQLKSQFTSYELEKALKMKSNYTIRFYEITKDIFNHGGTKIIDIDELRMMLGIDEKEYKLYSNFKLRVLLPSQKEMNNVSDLRFDFEEKKKGRRIDAIKFYVFENNQTPETKPLFTAGETAEIVKDPVELKAEIDRLLKEIENMEQSGERQTNKSTYYELMGRLGEARNELERIDR
jgi:plasmid replication initiation protein